MSGSERRWTAYHEAGHAVIHALLGIRFLLVTIVPSGHLLGRVEREQQPIWRGSPTTHAHVRRLILCLLAGGIAERLARRDGQASGLEQDRDSVVPLIAHLPGSRTLGQRVRRHIEMHLRAESLVRRHWNAIDEVAQRLIRDKTLKEQDVLRILRQETFADALAGVILSDKGLVLLPLRCQALPLFMPAPSYSHQFVSASAKSALHFSVQSAKRGRQLAGIRQRRSALP
jgi:hypothetical protein